jgi:uncharacterized membrane protein
MFLLPLPSFFQKYYIDPILYDTGYNPVNTLTWALLLVLFVLFLFKLLRKMEVTVDRTFVVANIPYILSGALLRVVEDGELVAPPFKYLLITPLIYFLIFFVAITALSIAVFLKNRRGYRYERVYASIGVVCVLAIIFILVSGLNVINGAVLLAVFGIASVLTLTFYYGFRAIYSPLATTINSMVIFAQMTDATATFIAIDFFGYWEKHVLPRLAINLTGSGLVMFLLKFMIFIPILYYLDKELRSEGELNNFIKFALITIGLAPGVRDAVRLTFGV